jgi:transposase InsO family protein
MAVARRRPGEGLVHHSDRGVQYACGLYRRLLEERGMTCSMSRRGDCWDNAVAESFFSSLKLELIDRQAWATRAQVRRAVVDYIEVFFNRRRLHSSLNYLTPAEYEARIHHQKAAHAA